MRVNKVLLLAYPRSGSTWFRYCCELMTKIKTESVHSKKNPFVRCSEINTDCNEDPFIYKSHFSKDLDGFDRRNDFLFLLIRNYKECIYRNFYKDNMTLRNFDISDITHQVKHYIDNIDFFERWTGQKKLVYYEDLISNFEETFEEFLVILKIKNSTFKNFIQNYDKYKNDSLNNYKPGSHTSGAEKLYHSLKMTEPERKKWDKLIIDTNERLFCKYLLRYGE